MLDSCHLDEHYRKVVLGTRRGGFSRTRPFSLINGSESGTLKNWKLPSISRSFINIMKEFVDRKRRVIQLVGTPQRRLVEEVSEYDSAALERSFQGWWPVIEDSREILVRPRAEARTAIVARPVRQTQALELLSAPVFSHEPRKRYPEPRALTTDDFIQVMLATTRESYTHQRWPVGGLTKVMAAEVIKK